MGVGAELGGEGVARGAELRGAALGFRGEDGREEAERVGLEALLRAHWAAGKPAEAGDAGLCGIKGERATYLGSEAPQRSVSHGPSSTNTQGSARGGEAHRSARGVVGQHALGTKASLARTVRNEAALDTVSTRTMLLARCKRSASTRLRELCLLKKRRLRRWFSTWRRVVSEWSQS